MIDLIIGFLWGGSFVGVSLILLLAPFYIFAHFLYALFKNTEEKYLMALIPVIFIGFHFTYNLLLLLFSDLYSILLLLLLLLGCSGFYIFLFFDRAKPIRQELKSVAYKRRWFLIFYTVMAGLMFFFSFLADDVETDFYTALETYLYIPLVPFLCLSLIHI